MTNEAQKPADMTDQEWEALQSDEGGLNPDDNVPLAGDDELEDGGETPEQKAARETEEAAAAAAAAAGNETEEQKAARIAAEEAAANKEKPQPQAPVMVAQPPADADAKLAEIKTSKKDLATKFDDGELSTAEYTEKMEALNDQQRQIELAVHESNIAAKLNAQQARNTFLQEVRSFTDNTLYTESPTAWSALDAAVKKVGSDPENASLSGRQILEKAHAEVLKDPLIKLAFDARKPVGANKPADKKPGGDLPPNLSRIPAAESEDTNGDRFSSLDRLFARDPIAYEEAVGKLSQADRDAYLARA